MMTLKDLSRDLSSADDGKLAQIVAVVDRLQERGGADRLIAPLRPRLAVLRPPRPLRLTRLLFTPLDPLIVAPARWRPGALTFPRTIVMPFAATLQRALPPQLLQRMAALIAERSTADADVIAEAGALLWPAAASLLLEVPRPIDWDATGLRAGEYPPLAKAVGAVLTQAVTLHDLKAASRQGTPPDIRAGERMLRACGAHGPEAVARVLVLALGSLPNALALLRATESRSGLTQAGSRTATEDAVLLFLDGLQAGDTATSPLATCGLMESGATVRRLLGVLDQLADQTRSPERRQQIVEIKRALDSHCRKRFASALETELLQPIARPGGALSDAAMTGLEETARGLRRLEQAARQLGGAATYDALLQQTTSSVADEHATPALGTVDRVRMVEILAGPERALAILDRERA